MCINIALILGKNYKTNFERYSLPILGRPVAKYVIDAAVNTQNIDKVFLSTDSQKLLKIGQEDPSAILLERESINRSLIDEIRFCLIKIENIIGHKPQSIAILFANSPCITPDMLFNGFSFLEDNIEYDSIVSAMQRSEFTPTRLFSMKDNKLIRAKNIEIENQGSYFLDHRLMVTRVKNIDSVKQGDGFIENILGENIYPVIQTSGIWDIDYPWQIPQIEHWLLANGFTESRLPYKKKMKSIEEKPNVIQNEKLKVLVTTIPFGEIDPLPVKQLNAIKNLRLVINPFNRKIKEDELRDLIKDFDFLIAGTEPITEKVLGKADRLKVISRVGIGLDNVDLKSARRKGIKVCYTPDAPSAAVAELTIAHMLNLLRKIPTVDNSIRNGIWKRFQGERLATKTIGIIGVGRIGTRVIKHLQGFNPKRILINDLIDKSELEQVYNVCSTSKEEIYRKADVITLHVPLTSLTKNLVTMKETSLMKSNVILINTSRGGIINEEDLYTCLRQGLISGAAIDTFEEEPYSGKLVELDNCYISCHMGSMTKDCRARMEQEATEDVLRFINGDDLLREVPDSEFS